MLSFLDCHLCCPPRILVREITLNVFSSLNVDCGHYFRSTRSPDLNWSCDGLDRLCHGKISVASQSSEDSGQQEWGKDKEIMKLDNY